MAPQTGVFQDKSYYGDEDCLFINVFTPKVTMWNNWANEFPNDTKILHVQFKLLPWGEEICLQMHKTLRV